jgi:hypothetical protein
MQDKFLGFTYRGIHSTTYNAFIVNEGELIFSNSPSFSNEFAFPQFGESSYLLGVNKENRTFDLKVFLKEVSFKTYREFLN